MILSTTATKEVCHSLISFVFTLLLCDSAYAQYFIAKGEAYVEQNRVTDARSSALADAVRKAALSQQSRLISNSVVDGNGALHESLYVNSDLVIHKIDLINESKIGDLQQVTARIHFADRTEKKSCGTSVLKKPVSIRLQTDQNLQPADISFDSGKPLVAAYRQLTQLIKNSSSLTQVGIDNQNNVYLKSYFPPSEDNYTPRITLNSEWAQIDANHMAVVSNSPGSESADVIKGLKLGGLFLPGLVAVPGIVGYVAYPIFNDLLGDNRFFKKHELTISVSIEDNFVRSNKTTFSRTFYVDPGLSVAAPAPNLVNSIISTWASEKWPEIETMLNCTPLVTNVYGNEQSKKISIGNIHNLQIGQKLLLLPLDYSNQITAKPTIRQFNIYRTTAVFKTHSVIEIIGTPNPKLQPAIRSRMVVVTL